MLHLELDIKNGDPEGWPEVVNPGNEFKGWFLKDKESGNATEIKISQDTKVERTYDHELIAKWGEEEYDVRFDSNGGSEVTEIIKVKVGSKYGILPTTEKTGYTFKYWKLIGGDPVKEDTEVTTAANHTLYAHWEKEPYTITFNADGGEISSGEQQLLVEKDEPYGKYGNLPEATKEGYRFGGWYFDGNLIDETTTVTYPSTHELVAEWDPLIYTVTYNANGGSGAPGPQTKEHGIPLTISTQEPYRAGYDFLGWATYGGAASPQCLPGGTYTGNDDITLYAVWEQSNVPVERVTITPSEDKWISLGGSASLSKTVYPTDATNQNVTWSSSNPSVASVDPTTGLVRAEAVGKTNITVITADGNKKDSVDVYVYNVYIKENKTVKTHYIGITTGAYGAPIQELHVTRIKTKTGGAKFAVNYGMSLAGENLYFIHYNNNNYDIEFGGPVQCFTKNNLKKLKDEGNATIYGNIIN